MTRPLSIGYLVQQFPPEVGAGPARVTEMAARWREAGASVTVFTGMPNRPEGRIHAGYRGRLFMEESWDGIRVLRSWLYASPLSGLTRTLANNVSFMVSSAVHGVAQGGGIDVLIASSPPFFPHISGEVVAALRRIPLVLEVRDLWPDYLVGMGTIREGSLGARAIFGLERAMLRRADAVTVVTESFRRRVIEKGVAPDKVDVFPNGVDPGYYYRAEDPPPLESLRREPGEFLVGYLGNFGAGQALGSILEAANHLKDAAPHVRFVVVGDGPERQHLERRAAELGLRNLSLHPPIPKDKTRAFYSNCDLCLVPLAPIAVFQETVPSKIFEILACERPVLASLDGEGRHIVEESRGGIAVAPGDAAQIAEGILRLSAAPPSRRQEMGVLGRAYVQEHYARAAIAARYLTLLERVVGPRRGPG